MAKGNHTIINEMMQNAAEVIKNKIEYNNLVIQQLEEKEAAEFTSKFTSFTLMRLREENAKNAAAVAHIEENAGCWA